MIPWIRIYSYKGIITSKLTWLLLALCLVTLLAVVRWPKGAKKESIKAEEWIQIDDFVEITYTKKKSGKVLGSIVVIETR